MTAQTLSPYSMSTQTTELPHASARFWDKHARKYARGKIADQAGYEHSLERTGGLLFAEDHVLEIGCGTGTTALHHAPHVRHITGTDISPEMAAIANEKLAEKRIANADFFAAPADRLPFAAGSFDVVMGHNVYHLVDDVDAALGEAHRVTATGGIFVTKTPCLGEMNVVMRRLVLPVMKWWFGVPAVHTFTARQFRDALKRAGFDVIALEYHGTKGKDTRPFIVARKT